MGRVRAVKIYPVKGCGPLRVNRWPLDPSGSLFLDRRWCFQEIRAMLQNMFGGSSSSQSSQDPNLEHSQPSSFAPFSGKAHRLEEDPPAKNSWTKTDTASYTKGKDAGEKRKQQIESASGTAKRKFRKAPPLAITR
eukprot:g25834.t1